MKMFYILLIALFLVNIATGQFNDAKLNQIELMKQFPGSWKCEVNDTTIFWESKSYGTGIECNFKYITRGKVVQEGKQLWGYDKTIDKFIAVTLRKGMDIQIDADWFISQNKLESLYYKDIPDSEKASVKWELEFTSPDMFTETCIANGKSIKTVIFTRVTK